MKYRIYLRGNLFIHALGSEREIVIESDTPFSASEIAQKLGLPSVEVHAARPCGTMLPMARLLTEDTDIEFYPSIGGG